MVDRPTLEFLENQADETEGLADAGVETYRDAPYASCAREAGQNSQDAAGSKPVRITFNVIRLSKDDIPAHDIIRNAIKSCKAKVEQKRDQEFFANAAKIVGKKTISVLEIADYNTTGLIGPPDEAGTPFHSLVKASGVTVKKASNSGGSFGIGKNASFAVSDLRAVFYATVYLDNEDEVFAAQGKIKLISHTDGEGVRRRATGYWGNAKFGAVTDRAQVPEWMNRKEIGTSIFCLGFRKAKDWQERMVYSLVSNFFCGIHRGEVEFEVDGGKFSINRATLGNLLIQRSIEEAAKKAGHRGDLDFAGQLYRCLSSQETATRDWTIEGIGKMRVHILVEEGMPCRVGFIRNGMLITDTLKNFGDQLSRFPGARDFIALVEPAPDDVNAGASLKDLENPAHDGFSAERITDEDKKDEAITAMQMLARKLRETIKDVAEIKYEGVTPIDELATYFPGAPGESLGDNSDGEPDPEKYVYEARPPSSQEPTAPDPDGDGEEGGSGGTGNGSGEGGGGYGSGHGGGSGGTGDMGEREQVRLKDVRNTKVSDKDEPDAAQWRELHFTPSASGHIELEVLATGVNETDRLNLIESEGASQIRSGRLSLDVEKKSRLSVRVKFDEPYEGPVDLVVVDAGTEEGDQSP